MATDGERNVANANLIVGWAAVGTEVDGHQPRLAGPARAPEALVGSDSLLGG